MNHLKKGIDLLAFSLIAITLFFTMLALFSHVDGEAYYGAFETFLYNENWEIQNNNDCHVVNLPIVFEPTEDDLWILTNTLPDQLSDGMELCIRSSHQDIAIYVDGELRSSYQSKNIDKMGDYLPSSYVFAPIKETDSLKDIRIEIGVKEKSKFNEVIIGYGSNAWFPIMAKHLPLAVAGVLLVVFSLVSMIGYLVLRKTLTFQKTILYLSLTMFVAGGWILAESRLRQLIFESPSYSSTIAFLYLELIAGFALLYFNEVQKHRYERIYIIAEAIIFGQVLLNLILHLTGIAELYETLVFAHIEIGACFLLYFITFIIDVIKKHNINYRYISKGNLLFAIACTIEFICFFTVDFHVLGLYVSLGLILLFTTTVLQSISDEITRSNQHRIEQTKQTIETMLTIANTIDAKDDYTGGHSVRVAEYARDLAKIVQEEYHLSDDDINRVYYISLMHDIGKIGIPDHILKKAGKLTDEEYAIMKSHTTIGSNIFARLNMVEGLQDGIRHHHERFDGNGYPDHLAGEEISLFARILCIADCYDAMTSNRVYRKRLPDDVVKEEFRKNAGTQFDPNLVEAFFQMIEK